MRILDEREVAELTRGPVTIVKSALDLGRENVSGIKFSLSSAADGPVTVEFVEAFPGDFSMSDVQVHPSYYPELWTTSEARHRMVFEAELTPQSTLDTIYGVRTSGDDIEAFLGEPEHVEVSPVDGADPAGEPADAASDDGTSASTPPEGAVDREAASAPAAAPSEASATGSTTQADSAEGSAGATEAGADRTGSGDGFEFGEDRRRRAGGPSGQPAGRPTAPDSSVEAGRLIDWLARAELTDTQRARLRDAVDLEPSRTDRVQLDGLRSTVAELAEVAEATVGSVAALGENHAAMADDVEHLSARTREAAEDRDALRSRVDQLEGAVEELRETHAGDVDGLDARLAELEEVLDESDELEAIQEVIAAERAWRDRTERSRSRLSPHRASTG